MPTQKSNNLVLENKNKKTQSVSVCIYNFQMAFIYKQKYIDTFNHDINDW
jgi:hypothetical protein